MIRLNLLFVYNMYKDLYIKNFDTVLWKLLKKEHQIELSMVSINS